MAVAAWGDVECSGRKFLNRKRSSSAISAKWRSNALPAVSPSIDTARAEVCNAAMNKVTAFAVLFVVLVASACDRGEYATTLREFRVLAEQGLARAQYNLAFMYDNGQGVPQDHVQAVKWYRTAAEQGSARAQNNVGVMYHTGEGVLQDYAEAAKWYRKAAEQGYADAQELLSKVGDAGFRRRVRLAFLRP